MDDVFALLACIADAMNQFELSAWTTRVPSKSNPADLPSRGEAEMAARLFKCRMEAPWEASEGAVQAILHARSFLSFMSNAV